MDDLISELRLATGQFADLYFDFVRLIYDELGHDIALKLTSRLLYNRAYDRAQLMIKKAREENIKRTPDNILLTSAVAYSAWDKSLQKDHCPYGWVWRKKIAEFPWFREFAALYCDVTDTTIGEVFTGTHSHRLIKNVVLGDESCEREYFPCEKVKNGQYTYRPL